MRVKALLVMATLASFGTLVTARADIMATPDGIIVKPSDVAIPSRGMTMEQVEAKFGAPANKISAVGNPPISRWEYPGFVVYFERDRVLHTVVGGTTLPASTPAAVPAPAKDPASAPS